MNSRSDLQPPVANRRLIQSLSRALAGAVVGAGAALLLLTRLPDLLWADVLVLISALVCVISAVVLFFASFDRKALSRTLKVEGDPTPDEIRGARLQAGLLALTGLLIVAPIAAEAFAGVGGAGPSAPAPLYAALLLVFALQSIGNWTLWRSGDEMVRRLILESGGLTFWVLQAALFLYAAAERLGLVPSATAWDMFAVTMATYLLATCVVSLRRNLA
jgi:hypothetical protein